MPPASDTVMNSDDAHLWHVHVSAAQQFFFLKKIPFRVTTFVTFRVFLRWHGVEI